MDITADKVFGLLDAGLKMETARQETKKTNIAARQIAAAETVATPAGVPPAEPPPSLIQREVMGIPLWALLLGVTAAGVAAYKFLK